MGAYLWTNWTNNPRCEMTEIKDVPLMFFILLLSLLLLLLLLLFFSAAPSVSIFVSVLFFLFTICYPFELAAAAASTSNGFLSLFLLDSFSLSLSLPSVLNLWSEQTCSADLRFSLRFFLCSESSNTQKIKHSLISEDFISQEYFISVERLRSSRL